MRLGWVACIVLIIGCLHADEKASQKKAEIIDFTESGKLRENGKFVLNLNSKFTIINLPDGMNPYTDFEVNKPKDGLVIFRMMGEKPLQLSGEVKIDSGLLVVNPNGIIVGPNAVIDFEDRSWSSLEPNEANLVPGMPIRFDDNLRFNYDSLNPVQTRSSD